MLTPRTALAVFAAGGLILGPIGSARGAERLPPPVELTTSLSQSVLTPDARQTVYLRIGLKGMRSTGRERAPMNIALVIDRSGSMEGPRIRAARDAAKMAVDRLGPRDIVSVISYDQVVEVEVPATRATDKQAIKDRIDRLTARGSTAIWAGMQRGADEVRKFKSPELVNKIILLSDGLANVGPSKPDDFVGLGRQLGRDGITVSTIGLGREYNEDLMAGLARASEGTHKFVQEPADLAQFFAREFDDAQNVVAQSIIIHIDLAPGLSPGKGLGRDAEVQAQRMTFRLSQIIAETEQSVVAAIEVPATFAAGEKSLGRIAVSLTSADGAARDLDAQTVTARFSDRATDRDASIDKTVMRDVTVHEARAANDEAVKLRDQGRVEDARRKFEDNAKVIEEKAKQRGVAGDASVQSQSSAAKAAAAPSAASPAEWERQRKVIKENESNQSGARLRF